MFYGEINEVCIDKNSVRRAKLCVVFEKQRGGVLRSENKDLFNT